jgi:NAD(P)-dependent dehydrogenase (short-subunit alcohol dehydrogenase family)
VNNPADPLDFSGAVVVVTGGGRGVGRGISDRFLDAGATVVVASRTCPEPAGAGSAEGAGLADGAGLAGSGGRSADWVACDVRDAGQVATMIATVVERHGRLDVVVNNAGGSPAVNAADASPRFSESIIRLNLLGPLHVAKEANAVMQTQEQGGVIINIGSVSGIRPTPTTAAYGAAKAGLANLTTTLAVEWAPKVRVNMVTAGLVETEQSELFYGDAAGIAAVGSTVPLGRLAQPRDIGDACLFVASALASYMTGSNLLIHGGGERPAYLAQSTAALPGRPA